MITNIALGFIVIAVIYILFFHSANNMVRENYSIGQKEAENIALNAVGTGRVTWVGREDDYGAKWEIEITLPNGRELDVLISPSGQVINTIRK